MTPDGGYVYVANQGTESESNNTGSVIDAATGEVIRTLTTGRGAHGVSTSADGAFVLVTNIAVDSSSVIDRPNGIVYGISN